MDPGVTPVSLLELARRSSDGRPQCDGVHPFQQRPFGQSTPGLARPTINPPPHDFAERTPEPFHLPLHRRTEPAAQLGIQEQCMLSHRNGATLESVLPPRAAQLLRAVSRPASSIPSTPAGREPPFPSTNVAEHDTMSEVRHDLAISNRLNWAQLGVASAAQRLHTSIHQSAIPPEMRSISLELPPRDAPH